LTESGVMCQKYICFYPYKIAEWLDKNTKLLLKPILVICINQ
jgi:hypothetical protein